MSVLLDGHNVKDIVNAWLNSFKTHMNPNKTMYFNAFDIRVPLKMMHLEFLHVWNNIASIANLATDFLPKIEYRANKTSEFVGLSEIIDKKKHRFENIMLELYSINIPMFAFTVVDKVYELILTWKKYLYIRILSLGSIFILHFLESSIFTHTFYTSVEYVNIALPESSILHIYCRLCDNTSFLEDSILVKFYILGQYFHTALFREQYFTHILYTLGQYYISEGSILHRFYTLGQYFYTALSRTQYFFYTYCSFLRALCTNLEIAEPLSCHRGNPVSRTCDNYVPTCI